VRRRKVFNHEAARRKAIWRIIQGLGIDQTEDYDTCLMWIVRCMPDYEIDDTADILMKDSRRFATAITEEHAERIVEAAGPYRRWTDEAVGWGIRLTYNVRQAFRAWNVRCFDVSRNTCIRRRKTRAKERKARQRRQAGALPRGESQEQRRPWLTARISRRQWFRNKAKRLPQSRHMALDGTVSSTTPFIFPVDKIVPITTRIYPGQVLRGEVGPSAWLVALGIPVPSTALAPAPACNTRLVSSSLVPDEPRVERDTITAETCARPRGGMT
jgi:hypothetical protein